jgi:hypothetical protein
MHKGRAPIPPSPRQQAVGTSTAVVLVTTWKCHSSCHLPGHSDLRSMPLEHSHTETLPPGSTTSADSMSETVRRVSCKNYSIWLHKGWELWARTTCSVGCCGSLPRSCSPRAGTLSDWRLCCPGEAVGRPRGQPQTLGQYEVENVLLKRMNIITAGTSAS